MCALVRGLTWISKAAVPLKLGVTDAHCGTLQHWLLENHIPLQHHELCSKFEGMCCFDLAAEPVGVGDIMQYLKDYRSQPTGGA